MGYLDRVGVWERQDGGLSITYFHRKDMLPGETEDQFIARYTARLKNDVMFGQAKLSIVLKANIPVKDSQRNEWSLKAGKVEVDPVKVQAKALRKGAQP